jgi:lysophospholipase L1-like esterase
MKRIFAVIIFAALSYGSFSQSVAPFKKGDRVAFVGNSITDGGHYHSYIWLYYMTRMPDQKLTIYNAGIGGDVAENIYQRLDRDVFNRNPSVVVLTFGMNDTGYFEFLKKDGDSISKQRIAESKLAFGKIEEKLKQHPGTRKVMMSSSPYDETSKFNNKNIFPGKSKAMLEVADFQEATARKNHWGFVDFIRPMTKINLDGQKVDSTFTICGTDRIHPGNAGHLIMASLFLEAQGFSGRPVSVVEVNAVNMKVAKTENCAISKVVKNRDGITFTYLADALPYPVDTIPRGWMEKSKQSDALKVYPFTENFNREMLTITDLKPGSYKLLIDGNEIGTWDAKDLAAGINLAEQTRTPQYQQAVAIRELNEERWEIERRFRQKAYVEFNLLAKKGLYKADNRQALDTVMKYAQTDWAIGGNKDVYLKARFSAVRDAWEKEMQVLIDKIYSINRPVARRIELRALK